jgi:hypothetical protein
MSDSAESETPKHFELFISYSRLDSEFTNRLYEALIAKEYGAWFDTHQLIAGHEFAPELYEAIERADVFLFILSPDSMQSAWCNKELSHARSHSKRIIPIVWRDVDAEALSVALETKGWKDQALDNWTHVKTINWLLMQNPEQFIDKVEALHAAIQTDLAFDKEYNQWLNRAFDWQKDGKLLDNSLLSGRELDEALAFQKKAYTLLRPLASILIEYLQVSEREQQKRRRNTIYRWSGAGATFLVIVSMIGAIAYGNNIRANAGEFYNRFYEAEAQFNGNDPVAWRVATVMYCGALRAEDLLPGRTPDLADELFKTFDCPVRVNQYVTPTDVNRTIGQLGRACLFAENYTCARRAFSITLQSPQVISTTDYASYENNLILTLILINQPDTLRDAERRLTAYSRKYPQNICNALRLQIKLNFTQQRWVAVDEGFKALDESGQACSQYREELAFMRAVSLQQRTPLSCEAVYAAWERYEEDSQEQPTEAQQLRATLQKSCST